MTIYNMYMFDRNGTLLHYAEWHRNKEAGMSRTEEAKLMYGMIFSLKSFVSKVSPLDIKDGYLHYSTNKYRLHLYETPSRLRIVLNTDLLVQNVKELLHLIFSQVYVEYVVHNPECALGQPIQSQLFATRLDEIVKQHPGFAVRSV
ncbi:trafficking protein particle complex subunit 1 [Hyalella azteca]|uniref:Trafficking protein particle complex subunit n=1 Tax=Hyalella azteca TaxID=294128 RepID=A0A8B7PK27_HYAAZ|nr:trafficking protein particle complex subunit 1 [Hyalella azteca]XP_018026346.1 trafficking protein particle complex subunit 1 [Hyalella azteca]XP_047740600.1 trafficking protein particle complex subunit 1 [Hyalella azteca]